MKKVSLINKRFVFTAIITILIVLVLSSFIIAQNAANDDPLYAGGNSGEAKTEWANFVQTVVDGIADFAEPVFGALLGSGDLGLTGDALLVKILAFILVVTVVYGISDSINVFGANPTVNLIIGVVIAILGVRFIPAEVLEQAAAPSSALAAFLFLIIPFIIVAYIIEKSDNRLIRKVGWVAYLILTAFMYFYNWGGEYSAVYIVIAVACVSLLLLDRTVHAYFAKEKMLNVEEETRSVSRTRILGEIRDLESGLSAMSPADQKKTKAQISRKRKALENL